MKQTDTYFHSDRYLLSTAPTSPAEFYGDFGDFVHSLAELSALFRPRPYISFKDLLHVVIPGMTCFFY
jgi:hypothetical protein